MAKYFWIVGSLAMLLANSFFPANADTHAAHEYTLRLQTADASATEARPERQLLTVTGPRPIPHRAPRNRLNNPQAGQLLIVAVDSAGAELARTLATDPRVVTGELSTNESGNRTSRSYKTDVSFKVILPAHAGVARLRVFQPVVSGDTLVPQLLSDAPVAAEAP